jgi:hypothetical protein
VTEISEWEFGVVGTVQEMEYAAGPLFFVGMELDFLAGTQHLAQLCDSRVATTTGERR